MFYKKNNPPAFNTRSERSRTCPERSRRELTAIATSLSHSLASIEKAETLLGYKPSHNLQQGLKEAVKWYWENLK